jgi:ribosome-binding factor A
MRTNPRVHRVADRIQAELSEIIQRRLKDPRRGFLTVTGVEMADDLRSARVFVSALTEDDLAEGLTTLEHARGFIRTELGRRIRLRHTPELYFRPDRSAENAIRISELLEELRERGELGEDGPASGEPTEEE